MEHTVTSVLRKTCERYPNKTAVKYKENNKTTLTNKTQMIIGDYWKCL